MREDQIDQAERRRTLENDRQLLEREGSTFYQDGLSQADEISQGRFAATGSPRVIGSTPTPASQYPAASAHQSRDISLIGCATPISASGSRRKHRTP
jgi:hypothetical protein